jgi:hypothetical protein
MKKAIIVLSVLVYVLTLINFPGVNAAKAEEALYDFDFEDLSVGNTLPTEFTWNNVGGAKIVDVDGSKMLELTGPGYNFIFIGEEIVGDFAIELKMKVTKHVAKGGAQFTFREDKSKNNARYGYHVCYGDMTTNEYGVELRKRVFNEFTEKKLTLLEYDGEWHVFKAEVVGNYVKLFMDGNVVAEQEMTGYDKGHITISTYLETVLFDDIKISKLVDKPVTEPTTEPVTPNPTTEDSVSVLILSFFFVLVCLFVLRKKQYI